MLNSSSSGRAGGQRRGSRQGEPTSRGAFSPQSNRHHFQGQRLEAPRGPLQRERPGGTIFKQDRPITVDARIKDGSDKATIVRLNKAGEDVDPNSLPLRPDYGIQGKEIVLRANYFPVGVQGKIYQYNAGIILSDKKLTRRIKQRVFKLAEQTEGWKKAGLPDHVAHDGAEKLVASTLLPQPLMIRGTYYEEDEDGPPSEGEIEYTFTLTEVGEIDQEILDKCLAGSPVDSQALAKVLSALNLVLTAHTSQPGIKIGRDDENKKNPDQRLFFNEPDPIDIKGGLTVREGFYVSVRPAHQQLMVNINTCHAAFYKPQNFVQALNEYRQFTHDDIGAFGTQVRVMTEYNKRTVMIRSLSKKTARQQRFQSKFGNVTVENYFKRKWNLDLEHPDLPLLEGSDGNFYPAEFCYILPGQGFKGKLTDGRHAKAMLDMACKPPKENAEKIVDRGVDMLGFGSPNPLLESFGIHVSTEMAVVPGRILHKPGLTYASNKPAVIDPRASWNLRDVKFAKGGQLDKWAVLVIQDGGRDDFGGADDKVLRDIITGLRAMCNRSGMQVQPFDWKALTTARLPPKAKGDRFREVAIHQIKQVLVRLMQQTAPKLVLIMLSNEDEAIYNGVKKLCDVELDLATVCMQSQKVKRDKGQLQYLANITLKVNMKLGGINHKLDANSGAWLKSASTMIMGMDVTHPTGGFSAAGAPSIVAVVASVDQYFAQYPAILGIRRSRVEIDHNEDNTVSDMFISRFELYMARNGNLPKRVILFRDGVSESQFVQVRQHEFSQMERAFKHFGAYRPNVSIVVCGKRHNTRFYPTQPQDAAPDGNPLPGTIVDRGVTPAYEFDFFLQAHAGLKGTARPTHYFVVHDENRFTADELQRVTNDLSYMFARATKAVSLVSPAYWADIACERGRCYLHKLLMRNKNDTPAGGKSKGKSKENKDEKKRAEDVVFQEAMRMWGNAVSGPNLRDTMFYL